MKKILILIIVCLISACNKPADTTVENTAKNTNNNIVKVELPQETLEQTTHKTEETPAETEKETKTDEENPANNLSQKELNEQLLEASEKGNLEEVKKLIAQGADVNYQDENGRNVLMYAVLAPFGHYPTEKIKQIIKILTDEEVDVNKTDKEGNTALIIVMSEWSDYDAINNEKVELIDILVSLGANVNATNKKGETALMSIHLEDYTDYDLIVKKLLSVGANINAKNNEGRNVLMDFVGKIDEKKAALTEEDSDIYEPDQYPSINKVKSFLKTLISNGADINAKDNTGKTALEIAKEKGNTEIVKILKQAGAKE
jgi:ankyrin repeat protein